MKIAYNDPGMEIKVFDCERLLTASEPQSADTKAEEALTAAGTTQNVKVQWTF